MIESATAQEAEEHISNCLLEVADLIRGIELIAQQSHDEWLIDFGHSQCQLDLHLSENGNRLVFSVGIGSILRQDPTYVMGALLHYNMLSHSLAGLRLGMAGLGGEVIISAELPLEDVSNTTLSQTLETLNSLADAWKGFIAKMPSSQNVDVSTGFAVRV